jgi:hypothetical protein
MSKISERVESLSRKIMEGLEMDIQTGIAKERGSLYEENLPEGITATTVEAVKTYDADYVSASAYAFGQMANKAAQDNPQLTTGTCSLQGGYKDVVTHSWNRQRTYPNRLAGDGAEVVKHGVLTTVFETRAGKNAGQLKSVRDLIAQQMEEIAKS